MLPRRKTSGLVAGAALFASAVLQPGCVVRDRVEIVPRDWSVQQADAGEAHTPPRPGGRVGTNAVLPDPVPVAPESTQSAAEPLPPVESDNDTLADAQTEDDTAQDTTDDPMPAPDVADEGDAVAQGEPETPPDAVPDAAPDATPDSAPDTATVRTLDPPLHEAWAEGSAYNRRYVADSDPATASGAIDAVGTFVPAEGASPGLLLTLGSGDSAVAIHVAPLRYLRAMGLRFDFGEPLTVTGRWVNLDGKRILLAQAITRGDDEIAVRDAQTGRPVWVDPLPAQGDVVEQAAPADQAAGDSPTT